MILFRILKRDLSRSRGTMALVFAFVTLSALLMSGGAGLVVTLAGALDGLFEAARVPDVVQMHTGDIDYDRLNQWAESNPMVAAYQTAEMITVDGEALYLGSRELSENESVMDISFVRENETFDLLLDKENRPYQPRQGMVGVPIYFAQRDNLQLGDPITLRNGEWEMELSVGAIIRDAQMNPSIVHSKRFVVHIDDYEAIRREILEIEYLISFQLQEPEMTEAFMASYHEADLPKAGPMVDKNLFRILNALSDGIVAAVVILLSGLLMLIAILCLRFTILASIEEEYREIGVMKAIGLPSRSIRRIYVAKYLAVALLASAIGYLLSLPLTDLLVRDISVYLGRSKTGVSGALVPVAAAMLVFVIVVVSCFIILRRFRHISAVAALRSQGTMERGGIGRAPRLSQLKGLGVNMALGLRDVIQRLRLYGLLGFIYFIAAFIIIVPVHFHTTITSLSFVSYMGIGRSDLRIDLQQSESVDARFTELESALAQDSDVVRHAALITSRFTLLHESGESETIVIETGDIGSFPLDYLEGKSPETIEEIAFSYLNARDLGVEAGDKVSISHNDVSKELVVSGVYQDVTNGGRTAKARLPYNRDGVLWYSFAVDLAPGVAVADKTREYSSRFASARVTDLAGYMDQTLGSTVGRLKLVTIVAIILGLGISVLVTSLFLQMLIRKDSERISVMQNIGFSVSHIRRQYQTAAIFVLTLGLLSGTIFSNTLGEKLVSFLWSFMGAARIQFIVDPLKAYIVLPLLFAAAVAATTRITMSGLNKTFGGIK